MSLRAEALAKLRLLPEIKTLQPKHTGYQAPGLDFGIPAGTIIEVVGSTPKEFVIEFLVLNKNFLVFWAEKEQIIFPPFFKQRGFEVSQVTFATYGDQLAEAVNDILRNGRYNVVVSPSAFTAISRDRFGRLCRDKKTILFMVGEKPTDCNHIDLQLEIHRAEKEGNFEHEVLKRKHGRI